MLLMSEGEFISPKPANFLVTAEEKPRFNLRGQEDMDESKATATIVAANALRAHDDIFVSGNADVFDGLFVNGVQMRNKHNGSLPVNEKEIALADERLALEFFAKTLEQLLLRGSEEIFQILHADTSSALQ